LKLQSEILGEQERIKNYLKRHDVIEFRLKLKDGTIIDGNLDSSQGTLLQLIQKHKIEFKRGIKKKIKSQESKD
jgi:hypothetical protein